MLKRENDKRGFTFTCCISSLYLVAAVGSVSCSSEVRENRSSYPCCGEGTIKFNQQCESIFNVNNTVKKLTPKNKERLIVFHL